VSDLSIERPWLASIQIPLTSDQAENHHHNDTLFADITWDDGREDNAFSKVFRGLSDTQARGMIRVDIGHHCYEGWNSDIEFRDYSELPQVWFSRSFVNGFFDKFGRPEENPWDKVEEAHARPLVLELYREGRRREVWNKSSKYEDFSHIHNVVEVSRGIWKGNRQFSELSDLCQKYVKEQREEKEYQLKFDLDIESPVRKEAF
jgi:hypothetical protein